MNFEREQTFLFALMYNNFSNRMLFMTVFTAWLTVSSAMGVDGRIVCIAIAATKRQLLEVQQVSMKVRNGRR
jgi:hypothetical protein